MGLLTRRHSLIKQSLPALFSNLCSKVKLFDHSFPMNVQYLALHATVCRGDESQSPVDLGSNNFPPKPAAN